MIVRMIENRYAPPKIRTITEIVPSKMNEKKHSIAANPVGTPTTNF